MAIGELFFPRCVRRAGCSPWIARRALFQENPATYLIKLRQYGETLAQLVAAKAILRSVPPIDDRLINLDLVAGSVDRLNSEIFGETNNINQR